MDNEEKKILTEFISEYKDLIDRGHLDILLQNYMSFILDNKDKLNINKNNVIKNIKALKSNLIKLLKEMEEENSYTPNCYSIYYGENSKYGYIYDTKTDIRGYRLKFDTKEEAQSYIDNLDPKFKKYYKDIGILGIKK